MSESYNDAIYGRIETEKQIDALKSEVRSMMTESNKPLSDVLNALAFAMTVPDARTLEDFVRRHPQHADALTEFAVELALEPVGEEEGDEDIAPDAGISPAVAKAISHFQNVAFELEREAGKMTDMIEKVARAIHACDRNSSALRTVSWDSPFSEQANMYRKQARAAIEALMEPSKEMVKAGGLARMYAPLRDPQADVKVIVIEIHQAMLTAALDK